MTSIHIIPVLLLLLVLVGWFAICESDYQRRNRLMDRRAYERALEDLSDALITADILMNGWRNGHTPADVVADALLVAYEKRQLTTAAYFEAYPEDKHWKWR